MMIGLLLTSTISGRLISRWAFPMVGTLIIAVGLFLLSRMDQSTSVTASSAVPFALVTFILTPPLPEVPMRETSRAAGAAYAMPSLRSSLDEIARALSMLAGREGKSRLYERIMSRINVDLNPVDTWLLCHLDRDGPASVPELAGRLHRPAEDVETRLNRLIGDGLIAADDGRFRPTAVGQELLDQVRAAEHDTLADLFSDWPPKQRHELANVLTPRQRPTRSSERRKGGQPRRTETHRYLRIEAKPRPNPVRTITTVHAGVIQVDTALAALEEKDT
jgi:DNA-binding MarR family transcriptional regulator